MNQASVDRSFRYACDLLAEQFPGQLAAIFSPQHGLWCEEQANMIESPHGRYEPLGLPVYSLYSETRQPTAEMLRGLDCFVIDLQDVGTRVYTFAWTMQNCLRACAAAGFRSSFSIGPIRSAARSPKGRCWKPAIRALSAARRFRCDTA